MSLASIDNHDGLCSGGASYYDESRASIGVRAIGFQHAQAKGVSQPPQQMRLKAPKREDISCW